MTTAPAAGKPDLYSRNWPVIYSEELYRQGGSCDGQVCSYQFDGPPRDKQACIGETNAIMAILEAEVVYPLSGIPNLHKRVRVSVLDPKLFEEITNVFLNRMKFLAPPPDSALGPRILGIRDNLRMRTINLMLSQAQLRPFVEALAAFYHRYFALDQPSASDAIIGQKESVVDTIASWAALCIIRGTVKGDGTYTVRERTVKAQTGAVGGEGAVAPRAAAQPQRQIAVISPEEYQRQVQEGRRAAEPLPPDVVARHDQLEQFYMRIDRDSFKAQQARYDWESTHGR